jgi:hypothetical protein
VLERGGWSVPRPGRFTPGKDTVPIVQEAEWASGPVWRCAKNLAPTGIRSPHRPARSQSLYRLSYLAHICNSILENSVFLHIPSLFLALYHQNKGLDLISVEAQIHTTQQTTVSLPIPLNQHNVQLCIRTRSHIRRTLD